MRRFSLQAVTEHFRTKVIGRKFVKDVGALTAANAVGALLSVVQFVLVARWLGPELYGKATLAMAYPNLLFGFLDTRSAEASTKYLGEFTAQGEKDRALAVCKLGYTVDLGTSLLTLGGVAVTAWWAEQRILHASGTAWLMIVYAAGLLPWSLGKTSHSVFATLGRFRTLAGVQVLTAVLRAGLVLGLVLAGWGVAGVVWGNSLAMASYGVILIFLAYPAVTRKWGGSWLFSSWQSLKGRRREILGFVTFNFVSTLLGVIPKQMDLVLLGYFRGATEVGYYRLAKGAASTVGYLVGPLQSVAYPDMTRLWGSGAHRAFREKVRRLALQVGFPASLVALAGTLLIPIVLPLLVGHLYLPASRAAQILVISAAVWLAFFWLRPMYLAKGWIKLWAIGIGCHALLFLLVMMIFAPSIGYMAVAWGSLTVNVGFHVLMAWFATIKKALRETS